MAYYNSRTGLEDGSIVETSLDLFGSVDVEDRRKKLRMECA